MKSHTRFGIGRYRDAIGRRLSRRQLFSMVFQKAEIDGVVSRGRLGLTGAKCHMRSQLAFTPLNGSPASLVR